LNREKQAAARQFMTDLKDFHGIDAHALTPKTKLDHFWRLATNDLFTQADQATQAMALGQKDVHQAMIALEQANLAFRLMIQVRNKMISAYEEIMRMQV